MGDIGLWNVSESSNGGSEMLSFDQSSKNKKPIAHPILWVGCEYGIGKVILNRKCLDSGGLG